MLFLILTGLPWSGFWGTNFQNAVTNSGAGYPPSIWTGSAPQSEVKTKEIAEVPWGAENLDVPKSALEGYTQYESFSAAGAVITINGTNIHPGTAKGKMVNSMKIAMELQSRLPDEDVVGIIPLVDIGPGHCSAAARS